MQQDMCAGMPRAEYQRVSEGLVGVNMFFDLVVQITPCLLPACWQSLFVDGMSFFGVTTHCEESFIPLSWTAWGKLHHQQCHQNAPDTPLL